MTLTNKTCCSTLAGCTGAASGCVIFEDDVMSLPPLRTYDHMLTPNLNNKRFTGFCRAKIRRYSVADSGIQEKIQEKGGEGPDQFIRTLALVENPTPGWGEDTHIWLGCGARISESVGAGGFWLLFAALTTSREIDEWAGAYRRRNDDYNTFAVL